MFVVGVVLKFLPLSSYFLRRALRHWEISTASKASQQQPPCLLKITSNRVFLVIGFQNFPCGAVLSSPPLVVGFGPAAVADLGSWETAAPKPLASKPPLILRGSLLVLGAQCITLSFSLSVKNFWPPTPPPFQKLLLLTWEKGFRARVVSNKRTTLSNGYLGSCNDEERSEMRYLV